MTDIIDIQVRDSGTPVVVRNLESIGKSAEKAASGVSMLQSAMAALGTFLAIDKLMQWADAWNSVDGLVRTSTKSLSEANAVMERVFQAAQKTRTPLSEMGDLYTSTARAGASLGASQEQVIKFSEGVGKALAIQHTTANQARGALIQLGQAVAMGNIRAQEYNSLLQNGQVILQTVAQNLEGVDGSVAKLSLRVKSGGVTSKEFFDAFLKGADDLDTRFNQTSFLFSQAFVVMGNAMAKYLGQMDHALGTSGAFVKFVQWIGANMPIAAGVVLGFGTAIAVALSPLVILTFIGYMQVLYALILANPFTAFAAVISGIAVALYTMRDSINLGLGDATTLGDLMTSIWADFGNTINNVGSFLGDFWDNYVVWANDAFNTTNAAGHNSAEGLKQDFNDFFADTGEGWLGWLRGAAKVFDAIIGLLGGTVIFMKDVFLEAIDYLGSLFRRAYNSVAEFVEKSANAFLGFKNSIREDLGLEAVDLIKIERVAEGKEVFKTTGQIWAESMDTAFQATSEKGMGQWLEGRIKLAQGIRMSKPKAQEEDLTDPMGTFEPLTGKDTDKAAKALARLQDELDRTIGKINPMLAAWKEVNDAKAVFAAAVDKDLISQKEADKYMGMLKENLREALDPLKFMNEELDLKAKLLGMNNREAAIEEEMYGRTESLRRKGVVMTIEETDALRAKLVVSQELNRIAQARDAMEGEGSVAKMDEFNIQLKGMQELIASGGLIEGDIAGQLSKLFPWANLDGTQEQMAMFVQQHADMYQQIAALEDAGVIKHETANSLKRQSDVALLTAQLQGQRNFFDTLAGLSTSSNRKLAMIGKAAAITRATIDGYLAIQTALAAPPGWPYNAANVVATTALQAANVAAIVSQSTAGFRTGGNMTVGGSGGDDSQLVQFRATPGERVTVNTPSQARALENGGNNNAPTVLQPKVAVFMNPDLMSQFLESDEGDSAMQVWMSKNGYETTNG